jgi:hypothetical protein
MATAQEESSINLVLSDFYFLKRVGRKRREDSQDNDYGGYQFVCRNGSGLFMLYEFQTHT